MTIFPFKPCPSIGKGEALHTYWEYGFMDDEIKKIIDLGKNGEGNGEGSNLGIQESRISGSKIDHTYRKSKNSWIHLNENSVWLYERISNIMRNTNAQIYNFDLWGFVEPLQYTVYTEGGSHYDWHIDSIKYDQEVGFKNSAIDGSSLNTGSVEKEVLSNAISSPRKLSFTLQLSDPSEYEGGELVIKTSKDEAVMKKEKGFVVMFPSYVLHRVTPVTKGVRRSLVGWVSGPAFR